ncbi:hypothetical protein J0B02_00790 [Enterobacteriaceae bacterium YMB-R22]|jgi:hypothetical protein|uniref:hypothetical protein n=1 Tax=Tenebrionicola larvae TaxID=2815733 RepID=UPI002013B2AA|nr:hypothetical protein [Tenebrionicola larvae]MBV4411393.1 hypothetical protein [Tenebrionicola larvae]
MVNRRQPGAPVLGWIILFCWLAALTLTVAARKNNLPALQVVAIFLTTALLCLWLVYYYASPGFGKKERARLNRYWPLRGRGRVKSLMRWSCTTGVLTGLCLLALFSGVTDKQLWIMMGGVTLLAAGCLLQFLLFCRRMLPAATKSLLWRLFLFIYGAVLFIAKILAGGFLLEYMEISSADLPNLAWSVALFFSIPLFILVSYPLVLFLSEWVAGRVTRRKAFFKQMGHVQYILICMFIGVAWVLYLAKGVFLMETLARALYSYDTRSTMRCNNRYQTLYPFDAQARYFPLSDGTHRLFYPKGKEFFVAVVTCDKDGGINWYEVKTRKDLDQEDAALRAPQKR